MSTDTFQGADALVRSQGATTDGTDWYFSWQGGIQRTVNVNGTYVPRAVGTWPPQQAVAPSGDPTGTNHFGNNHIGDIDYDPVGDTIYAPFEDGGEGNLNNPEYQTPYIETYDPLTLRNTGAYPLALDHHAAGVPWVAIDSVRRELITAEWEMPNNRINIYKLSSFQTGIDTAAVVPNTLTLHYPAGLTKLDRIQGAKVYGDTLYATRDAKDDKDTAGVDQKQIWAINLITGDVKKLLTFDPGVPSELEGLALWPMADGSLLHVLIVMNNQIGDPKEHVEFRHYAPVADKSCPGPSVPEAPLVPLLVAAGVVAAAAVTLRRRNVAGM